MKNGTAGTSLLTIKKEGERVNSKVMNTITIKQMDFVNYLMQDPGFDPRKAAAKAGYKSVHVMGYKLLKKRSVQEYLGTRMRERERATGITNARILQELERITLRDPIGLCDENGLIITDDLRKIPEDMRRNIDGIEVKQRLDKKTGAVVGQTIRLKLVSKATAIELSMKHRGLLAPLKVDAKVTLDWDKLIGDDDDDADDLVERRILETTAESVVRSVVEDEEESEDEDE